MTTTVPRRPPLLADAAASGPPAIRTAAARRRVSRRSLALSILVVLLGGLGAYSAGELLTAHTDVLAVARDVPVGSPLTAEDLVVASVTSDPHLSPIPAEQLPQVIGLVAQVPLARGELLTQAQVGAAAGLPTGEVLVALPLQEGQFPVSGLVPGQHVLVVATPGSSAVTVPAAVDVETDEPSVEAVVVEVGAVNPTTQVTVVDVRLPEEQGASMAGLASTGRLALVVLPTGD